MTLQDLEQYVRTYDRAIYRLMASGRAAPTEERLAAFESSIDFVFPDEFRRFTLSPMGGLYLEVYEELWARPTAYEGDEDWRSLYSLQCFGIAAGVPEWLDLREELNALPPEESDLVPFFARGIEPVRYCFDMDHQIVRWSPKDGSRVVSKFGFFEFLLSEIEALEERRQRLLEGGKKKKARKKA